MREDKEQLIDDLQKENAALREALKQARKFSRIHGYTMRQFALAIGITATQLSAWTDSIPTTEPDFKD
jgi:CRISPR/Cas system-associated protein endoribonuclease Cas2